MMRRQGSGFYDGWYSVPAGHVEEGELPVGALIREASEELNIDIHPRDINFAHIMYRTKHDETGDRVDLFFTADKWSGEIKNKESHKCDDIAWFSPKKLPENMMHHVKSAIESISNGITYSDLNLSQIVPNPSQ